MSDEREQQRFERAQDNSTKLRPEGEDFLGEGAGTADSTGDEWISVMGWHRPARLLSPFFQLTRHIKFSRFLIIC